ncbi:Methyltransferase type 11 domain protein, partial [mine drainage metagenome]
HRSWVAKIRFHGGMAAESLAFPNGSFTAVIGQYALEYTDMDRALAECVRVLAPRAHLAFVLHAREGAVVQHAMAQQTEIARILALDYFSLARDLARATAARAPQSVLTSLQQAFKTRSDRLKVLAMASREPEMYENIMGVTGHALGHVSDCPVELIVAKITEVEDALHYHALRTEALTRAALDERGIRQRLASLLQQGFEPIGEYPGALKGPTGLLGWSVVLARTRPDAGR